jgi:hypothetical protein
LYKNELYHEILFIDKALPYTGEHFREQARSSVADAEHVYEQVRQQAREHGSTVYERLY